MSKRYFGAFIHGYIYGVRGQTPGFFSIHRFPAFRSQWISFDEKYHTLSHADSIPSFFEFGIADWQRL
jgi:hypothetical protein